ncbi:hypothetical protein BH11MYX1_BH11MYX1_27710 [soil metagenome]
MACRGVIFAIENDVAAALLAAPNDDEVRAISGRVEEEWNTDFLAEMDKSWDAMHRALSDGTLDYAAGTPPLNRAILGGTHLYKGDDYIITLVDQAEVPAIAVALAAISDAAMRERYKRIVPSDYAPEYGDKDRDYTVGYFRDVAELYAKAAKAGRSVVFSVDQ